jgi:hypothetical protein
VVSSTHVTIISIVLLTHTRRALTAAKWRTLLFKKAVSVLKLQNHARNINCKPSSCLLHHMLLARPGLLYTCTTFEQLRAVALREMHQLGRPYT